jgi:cytosine/uracil/thiamine/allantoin permease
MINDIKNFLRGLVGGILALIALFFLIAVIVSVTRDHGRSAAAWDPVSYVQHFAALPVFWINVLLSFLLVLLVFSIGFYLVVRKTRP